MLILTFTVETDKFIEVDPSNIIVTGKYISKATSTGHPLDMETAFLDCIDLVTSYKHFCDTAKVSVALDHKVPQYA